MKELPEKFLPYFQTDKKLTPEMVAINQIIDYLAEKERPIDRPLNNERE